MTSTPIRVLLLLLALLSHRAVPAAAAPEGQITWAVHVSIAPQWFDPAETPGIITPFMLLYAMHDALVKPMPGNALSPSLAESWTAAPDGLAYEFVLRKGARFHDGSPVTAEDVKFSFERYRGANAKLLHDKVRAVETPDPGRVRFRFREPFPDFMTFYASQATGAGWIVPKRYVEKVGDEGFKKAPVGAGPYRFASFQPGVELRLEAFEPYWRKSPSVKTLVYRVIPDEATRLAALKRGEVDIAYSITGALAEELKRSPGLALVPTYFTFTVWLNFPEQWDAKSPWADRRVREAASLAIDRAAINQAAYLGLSRIALSFVPQGMAFFWKPPAPPAFDPRRARQLLAEAGYPNGLDAGDYNSEAIYGAAIGEPVVNYLNAAGIRARLRPLERVAFFAAFGDKKLRNLIQSGSGAPGNAATRLEAFVVTGGRYVYGAVPEVDDLFHRQSKELDAKRRETLLHRAQQILHERVHAAPILEPAFLNGVGPRLEAHGLGSVANFPYSSPYEDLKVKAR